MKLSKKIILTSLLFVLPLASCGSDPSEDSSSEPIVENTIAINDFSIEEGEAVDLYDLVTFEPASSVDTLSFTILEGSEFIGINANAVLTGVKVGSASVKAEADNSDAETTFNVTVTAAPLPEKTAWELFNEDGTFEGSLDRWAFGGETATLHQAPEGDADRGEEDLQIKLYTGDYEEGVSSSLVDLTMSYTFSDDDLEDGTYTLEFDLVGALTEVKVDINGNEFTSLDGGVIINGGGYNTTYLVYEQTGSDFTVKFTFSGSDGDVNWGYFDDVILKEGDTKPIEVEKNLVVDGGFEVIGAAGGDFSKQDAWQFAGTAGANEWGNNLKFDSAGAKTGSYGLNYWHGTTTEDDFTMTQTITIDEAGVYSLQYDIYGGDYTSANSEFTTVSLIQGTEELVNEFLNPKDPYTTVEIPEISLEKGSVDLIIRIQTTASNTWINLDNFKLVAA